MPAGGFLVRRSRRASQKETGTAEITTVLVDDGGTENGGIDSSDEQLFEITIEASNSQPSFDAASYSFILDENSDVDHVVGTVSASDPDPFDALTYSITSGNISNAFKIDSNGVIQVENFEAVDFEVNPVFNLTVQVEKEGKSEVEMNQPMPLFRAADQGSKTRR